MAQMEMAICLVGANLSQMENHLKNQNLTIRNFRKVGTGMLFLARGVIYNGTYTILNARHMGLSTRC